MHHVVVDRKNNNNEQQWIKKLTHKSRLGLSMVPVPVIGGVNYRCFYETGAVIIVMIRVFTVCTRSTMQASVPIRYM